MSDNRSVITGEFDRTDRYEAGLKSLANSLRAAFFILLLGIIGTLIYFFSGAGYFSVEPQQSVIVLRFGKVIATHDSGGHWYLPFPVNQFIRVQTSQQLLNVDFVPATLAAGDGGEESLEPGRDSYLLTGDANIVHSSWQYSPLFPTRFPSREVSCKDPQIFQRHACFRNRLLYSSYDSSSVVNDDLVL